MIYADVAPGALAHVSDHSDEDCIIGMTGSWPWRVLHTFMVLSCYTSFCGYLQTFIQERNNPASNGIMESKFLNVDMVKFFSFFFLTKVWKYQFP